MYLIKNIHKFYEEDDFQEGCIPNTGGSCMLDISFECDTLDELFQSIQNHFDCTKQDMDINSCDEDGRIDISILENGEGERASKKEIDSWRDGNETLYSATYTMDVLQVEYKTVKL